MTPEPDPALPEPWLRGTFADVHPLFRPVFFSFAQVREDLGRHVAPLSPEQVWRRFGKSSVGFHLKHIAGSVDRLSTYLLGGQLTPEQLSFLGGEHTPEGTAIDLLRAVEVSLSHCEYRINGIDPGQVFAERTVGRAHLPTTVIGLLVHLAEHTQRHLGQAITLSQLLQQPDVQSS